MKIDSNNLHVHGYNNAKSQQNTEITYAVQVTGADPQRNKKTIGYYNQRLQRLGLFSSLETKELGLS